MGAFAAARSLAMTDTSYRPRRRGVGHNEASSRAILAHVDPFGSDQLRHP
jgi:hypothetical protein